MSFHQLGLSPELCRALTKLEYTRPTPVQSQAIPVILQGRDLLAGAQTGTGKTAAFALPVLDRLLPPSGKRSPAAKPRALALVPTRELAAQVHEAFRGYGQYKSLRSVAVFGGVGIRPQIDALARGVDVVVATPGRLIDHMQQRTIALSAIEILILDEADRMLDMGFLPDLRRILRALPGQRQTLLLSATLADEVKNLAAEFMHHPVQIQIASHNTVAETVSHRVHRVVADRKRDLLVRLLNDDHRQTLVFCRTKRGTDRLCRHLNGEGIVAAAIHGDRSQRERTRALQDFKSGRTTVLVATDVAARGLDIEQLPTVINFDLPMAAGDYIHRVGRTGRAGAKGQAVSLVSAGEEQMLRDIQCLPGVTIETAPNPALGSDHSSRSHNSGVRAAARTERYSQRPRQGRGDRGRSSRAENFSSPAGKSGLRGQGPSRVAHADRQYEDSSWLAQVV